MADKITERLRAWALYNRGQRRVLRANMLLGPDDQQPLPAARNRTVGELRQWLYYLVNCDWCASIWIAPPVVAAAWFWSEHSLTWLIALGLTASHVAGWLGGHEASSDERSH